MKFCIFTFLLFFVPCGFAAAEVSPRHFAYGIPLTIVAGEALYELSLPVDVYRVTTRSDLGDICIFNGMSELVPFALYRTEVLPHALAQSVTLPIFPLTATPEPVTAGLSLQVRRDSDGSILRVDAVDGNQASRITSYLIDASVLKRPVAALALRWKTRPEGTMGRIRVEGSDDLENWTTLVHGATVLEIRYGEHSLERRIVETGEVRTKYFRLSSTSGEMPTLTAVEARTEPPPPELPREWLEITAAPQTKNAGDFEYDVSGRMPVDRVRVLLPQENSLVKATLYSRETEKDHWRREASAFVYRLNIRGEDISSPDIVLGATPHRYWLLRIAPGGGIGSGIPIIRFGWVPEKIIFAARGSGPFLLAYGSARPASYFQGGNVLFSQLSQERGKRTAAGIALPGTPTELGGKTALKKSLLPTDVKSAMLWVVLLMGVVLLVWMSVRLYRQMKAADENIQSTGSKTDIDGKEK